MLKFEFTQTLKLIVINNVSLLHTKYALTDLFAH